MFLTLLERTLSNYMFRFMCSVINFSGFLMQIKVLLLRPRHLFFI